VAKYAKVGLKKPFTSSSLMLSIFLGIMANALPATIPAKISPMVPSVLCLLKFFFRIIK
jgi:hypothetical protein